jgi:hypothetical protein
LPPKPSFSISTEIKIAYLFMEPRVETSLSTSGEGPAVIPSINISGPLVLRGLPKVPCGLKFLGRLVEWLSKA